MNDGVVISTDQFLKRFRDETTAREYLEARRWNGIPVCPHCGSTGRMYQETRAGVVGYHRCSDCNKLFTVRTGTIFERSHVSLDKWLFAMYLLAISRKGISSLQLSKELGVTQKTAWFMLQRLREACTKDDNDDDDGNGFLRGIIEVDDAYIGGKEANKHASKKLKAEQSTGAAIIRSAACETLALDSMLCTDEHVSYRGIPEYRHHIANHSAKQFVDGTADTNGFESVWALLKRGFYGVYHSFSKKHLQRYVDEFTYRLNESDVRIHTRWIALMRYSGRPWASA